MLNTARNITLCIAISGMVDIGDVAAANPPTAGSGAQDQDSVRQVSVTGRGATAPEARKDGWRAAVTQVVGTLVTAETLMKNQTIVQDNVSTLSRGFVRSYEETAVRRQDGIVEIDMRVDVVVSEITRKLNAIGVPTIDVDGRSLAANISTLQENVSDGRRALIDALRPFGGWGVSVGTIGDPTVRVNDGSATAYADVGWTTDATAYDDAAQRLLDVLDVIGEDDGRLRDVTTQFGTTLPPNQEFSACGMPLTNDAACVCIDPPSASASKVSALQKKRQKSGMKPTSKTEQRCFQLDLNKFGLTKDEVVGIIKRPVSMKVTAHVDHERTPVTVASQSMPPDSAQVIVNRYAWWRYYYHPKNRDGWTCEFMSASQGCVEVGRTDSNLTISVEKGYFGKPTPIKLDLSAEDAEAVDHLSVQLITE